MLVADVYEAGVVLQWLGERSAATERQTQARWQVLGVISEGNLAPAPTYLCVEEESEVLSKFGIP